MHGSYISADSLARFRVMYDLRNFGLHDMAQCAQSLRKLGNANNSLLDVAESCVRFFYDNFREADGTATCALVRLFATHRYSELSSDLQRFADRMLGDRPAAADLRCLTLLATAGDEPDWNNPHASRQHRAIPLPSEQILKQSPMIAQLIRQFGVDVAAVLQPEPDLIVDLEQTTFNVFHVAEAAGSPFVPAQEEFVVPHRIKSVLGCGGMLPTGELFAVVLFSKVEITRDTAEMFKTLALSIKVSLLFCDSLVLGFGGSAGTH